jgi:hypothetical protein
MAAEVSAAYGGGPVAAAVTASGGVEDSLRTTTQNHSTPSPRRPREYD